ncbi:MAG: RsmF rRNA methyltransferase first C-terminal domain-containing protein [Clostridia bacterium]|nr:RsmF rRNA methyltransferase first C-terminal domain-containing protein [Clostridia bacterium]
MLPEKFSEKMKRLLGDDYPRFIDALENEDAVRGLRINTLKCDAGEFLASTDLPLKKLSYTDTGFILESEEQVGYHPEHHSGRIYMQDPGAMMPLSSVRIPEGARVVDLCAAPGGKSGQAAAMIGEEGFILSNEFVPKRAKILVSNLERLGVKNAVVTSMDTEKLCEIFTEFFDYAIVDAPCSGEGMFRKNSIAIEEWSEENVEICAKRQSEILENAARLVNAGGYIVYSTCTYSPEENEERVDAFLKAHPEFSPVEIPKAVSESTAPPITDSVEPENVKHARRFYPHLSDGEGQFVAVLKKNTSVMTTKVCKSAEEPLTKAEKSIVNDFFKNELSQEIEGRAVKVGGKLTILTDSIPAVPQYSVFMAGVLIGEIQKGRLEPSHQLFSAYGTHFKRRVELSGREDLLSRYLYGEEIEAPDGISNGYCTLTYKGTPLGGGKISGGRIKNHYPKGLRNKR